MAFSPENCCFCLLILFFPSVFQGIESISTETPSKAVRTKQGLIQGFLQDIRTSNGDKTGLRVEVFRGVPFAAAPIGSLRFLPPVTPSPWKVVRETKNFGPACPQTFPDVENRTEALRHMSEARYQEILRAKTALRNESEDCLYMNIYVPLSGNI